jgi:lipoprotein-releasing system ATP-binding protein
MSDASTPHILKAHGIHKTYPHVSGPVPVLENMSLELYAGEVVAIVGKSGVGKSTLLHILGTLDHPTNGTLEILNTDVLSLADHELSVFRNRHIGFVFQFHHLLPEFSALENVVLPALIHGGNPSEAREKAKRLLDYVGLSHRLDHKPAELSGGEQQRVAIVRAIIMEPDIVLADEPTGNLDPKTGFEVQSLFLELSREKKITVVMATHNRELAAQAHRRIEMSDGTLHIME